MRRTTTYTTRPAKARRQPPPPPPLAAPADRAPMVICPACGKQFEPIGAYGEIHLQCPRCWRKALHVR
jgi:hypothetical protein